MQKLTNLERTVNFQSVFIFAANPRRTSSQVDKLNFLSYKVLAEKDYSTTCWYLIVLHGQNKTALKLGSKWAISRPGVQKIGSETVAMVMGTLRTF